MTLMLLLLIAQPTERVAWKDTVARFAGHEVEVELVEGKRLKGIWRATGVDDFTLRTKKGEVVRARSSIRKLRLHRKRTRGRWIGGITGYVGAVAVVGERIQGPGMLAVVGATAAGIWLGRELDRSTKVIELYGPVK